MRWRDPILRTCRRVLTNSAENDREHVAAGRQAATFGAPAAEMKVSVWLREAISASALQIATGSTFQISRAYSLIVRSLENFPIRAVLRIAIFAQRDLSRKAASTFFWHSL